MIISIVITVLLLFFTLIIFLYFIYVFFALTIFLGAPYMPAPYPKVKEMLNLANPEPGEILYDLGSGNGQILIEAAKNYEVKVIGIEINPLLVYLSRRKIKKLGLKDRVKVYWGNFLKRDISDVNIIITYLTQMANNKLEKKFLSELKSGTKIVSLSFTFKKIPLIKSNFNIRLYQIPYAKI